VGGGWVMDDDRVDVYNVLGLVLHGLECLGAFAWLGCGIMEFLLFSIGVR
jgi:hypothetical protein